MEVQQYIIYTFELVAAILATIHYKKYKKTTEKYFLLYLWYVIFTESLGFYLNNVLEVSNIWVMNIYIIITFSYFLWWYYTIVNTRKYKKVIFFLGVVFAISVVYNSINNGWESYLYIAFTTGAAGVLISTLFYFSELLNSDKVLKLKSNLRFWIATGMLLFSIGMIPSIFFAKFISEANGSSLNTLMLLNIILYSSYSLGFIWSKHHKTYSY